MDQKNESRYSKEEDKYENGDRIDNKGMSKYLFISKLIEN